MCVIITNALYICFDAPTPHRHAIHNMIDTVTQNDEKCSAGCRKLSLLICVHQCPMLCHCSLGVIGVMIHLACMVEWRNKNTYLVFPVKKHFRKHQRHKDCFKREYTTETNINGPNKLHFPAFFLSQYSLPSMNSDPINIMEIEWDSSAFGLCWWCESTGR
jgi:hypothetical protein